MPIMMVAGDHANHAMAGSGPDSHKSRLEKEGFAADAYLHGLGKVYGTEAKAEAVAIGYEARLKAVKARAAGYTPEALDMLCDLAYPEKQRQQKRGIA